MSFNIEVQKTLSANDVGTTGAHQAGMLIPKNETILSFFPHLNPAEKNPRVSLHFLEDDGITRWNFNFIYYNNKLFGGTRNEYRLTCMTKYLKSRNAKPGDTLTLSKNHEGSLRVSLDRQDAVDTSVVLVLSGGWKVINI